PKKFNVFGLKSYFINGKIYYFIGSDYQIPEYDYFINKNGDFIHQKRLWEINNFIVKTESSAIDSYYQRIRFSSGDDGKLKSGHTDDFDSWGDADFQGPIKSEDKEKYEGFTIFYLTPSSTFLIGKKDLINNSANDSLITYWYLDKRTQEWDTFNLSKFYSNFNVYNDAYLYGTGMNNLRFLSNADTISNLLEENSKFYSDSLGLIPIKQTLTGKFFIFHIPSKTFCEYLGNTQDTEVIQIIDDWIYYRDYDEIRRMKINHTSKIYDISTNELVVKDKYRVPMIHHLFFSNAYPKVNKKELFFQK
ncbi:MAG: hypothetical protein KDC04_08530, partial [Saprospiraceae bacterium]|nr:hypothetical protein [Saprospiraceae bacterium]